MFKYTQAIRRQKPTNCLSVFDHFVGLALKRLRPVWIFLLAFCNNNTCINGTCSQNGTCVCNPGYHGERCDKGGYNQSVL